MNSTIVFLFKRTDTNVPPAIPSADLNYVFATGFLSGALDGWEQSVPSAGGAYRWVTSAVISSNSSSATVPISAWKAVVLLAEDGTCHFTAKVYKQTDLQPNPPSAAGSSYDFTLGVLTPPAGWSVQQPNVSTVNTWAVEYTFVGLDHEIVVGSGFWSQPAIVAVAGTDGLNTHIVTIYRQTLEDPAYPLGGSYKFDGDILVAPSGWVRSMPTVSNVPTYASTHRFSSNDPSAILPANSWSFPVVVSRIGMDYVNRYKSTCFMYSLLEPATPTEGDYDNPVPTGWSDGIPALVAGQDLWTTTRTFYADNLLSQPWSTPVKVTSNQSLSSKLQFSTDNINWHDTPQANDLYMRSGTNDGNGWVFNGSVQIKGEQGLKGETGTSGSTFYMWVAYAYDETGTTGFTTGSPSPEHLYIGIAHNKTTAIAGTDPTEYTWTKFVGGVGAKGTDGVTTFTWYAYANSADGTTDFTTGAWTNQVYMGVAYNKYTNVESQNPADYQWVRISAPPSVDAAPAVPVFTPSSITMSCPVNADGIPIPVASLTWTSVPNATSYQLRYKTTGGYTYVTIANTPSTSSVVISGLLPATVYYWALRALTNNAASAWSNGDTDITKNTVADAVAPDVPTGLSLIQCLLTVVAQWTPLTGLANQDLRTYRMMVADNVNFNNAQTYNTPSSIASFSVTLGSTYWVKVCAVDASGNASNYGTAVSIAATKANGNSIITADTITASSLAAVSSTLGAVSAGSLTLNTSASFIRANKANYADTAPGFWLGNDGTGYRAHFGGASSYFKYDSITGEVQITGKITLSPASSGYANMTDKPTSLAGINATEGSKLAVIPSNATAGNNICRDVIDWGYLPTGNTIETIPDGKIGTKVLRMSLHNGLYPNEGRHFPIDHNKVYRVRFWARPVNANGDLYFSLRQFYTDGNGGVVAYDVAYNYGRATYQPGAISTAAHGNNVWKQYDYYWQDAQWIANATHVQPEFLGNYQGTVGYWEIQDFEWYDASVEVGLQNQLTDIAKDNILTRGEKPAILQRDWAREAEYTSIIAQADALGVDTTRYWTTLTDLTTWISAHGGLEAGGYRDTAVDTPLNPIVITLDNYNGGNPVGAAEAFVRVYSNYEAERAKLLKAMSAKAATLSTWTGTTGIPARVGDGVLIPGGSPAGLYLRDTYMGYWNGTAWGSYIQSDGKFKFLGNASNYIEWNGSTMDVRGSINADDIKSGSITSRTIQTATSGERFVIDASANRGVFYDATGAVKATIGTTMGYLQNCYGLFGSIDSSETHDGIVGLSYSNSGVVGNSYLGVGVYGYTSSGFEPGVKGAAFNGPGVVGIGGRGQAGIVGSGTSNSAYNKSLGGVFSVSNEAYGAPIQLVAATSLNIPTNVPPYKGLIWVGSNGSQWNSVHTASSGGWKRSILSGDALKASYTGLTSTGINITGLDGDSDEEWLITIRAKLASGAATYLRMAFNGDTNGANYSIANHGGTWVGEVCNLGAVNATYWGTYFLRVYTKSGGVRNAVSDCMTYAAFASHMYLNWLNSADNITSLKLYTDNSAVLADGTSVKITRI